MIDFPLLDFDGNLQDVKDSLYKMINILVDMSVYKEETWEEVTIKEDGLMGTYKQKVPKYKEDVVFPEGLEIANKLSIIRDEICSITKPLRPMIEDEYESYRHYCDANEE